MFVEIKALRHWKTEHSQNTCQDEYASDPAHGLFAVSDGAGTTLFPAVWARILAQHFIATPLMSGEPFEVEWWVRLAQEQYKHTVPQMEGLVEWNVRQKAQQQGSDATLATLRVFSSDAATAQAELLVFGDSCILIGRHDTGMVESFVLQEPTDFDRAPVCLPSTPRSFHRSFHTCHIQTTSLAAGSTIILATDAVSRWILSKGHDRYDTVWQAFQQVASQTRETWADFIQVCRDSKEMIDDDSTALVLLLSHEASSQSSALGTTTAHTPQVLRERKKAFEQAKKARNQELIAVYFGDGVDLKAAGISVPEAEIEYAHRVADALKAMLVASREALNSPNFAEKVGPVWQKYRELLQTEPCAENLRESLQRQGVSLAPAPPPPPLAPHPQGGIPPPPIEPAHIHIPADRHLPGPSLYHRPGNAGTPNVAQTILPLLQAAVRSNDFEQILDICLTLLENPDILDHYRDRVIVTRKHLFEHVYREELEELQLVRTFIKAYHAHDDEVLLATAEKMHASRKPALLSFTEEEEQAIRLARLRKHALDRLQKALLYAEPEQLVLAYNDYSALLQKAPHLTQDEETQVSLARQLVRAYESKDEDAILAAYDAINFSPYQKYFSFTDHDKQRSHLAQQLKRLRQALHGASPQKMVDASTSGLLDALRQEEIAQLRLAQSFILALQRNDDEAIVESYDAIITSTYRQCFAFTIEESERSSQARERLKAQSHPIIVATVNGRDLHLKQVKNVLYLKEACIHFWIRLIELDQKQNRNTDLYSLEWAKWLIANLRTLAQDDPQRDILLALDDIINDAVIDSGIHELDKKNAQLLQENIDAQSELVFRRFQQDPSYPHLANTYKFTDADVKEVLLLLERRCAFEWYLQKLPKKPVLFKEWLGKQRSRKGTIVYPAERTHEPDQRRAWLQKLLAEGGQHG